MQPNRTIVGAVSLFFPQLYYRSAQLTTFIFFQLFWSRFHSAGTDRHTRAIPGLIRKIIETLNVKTDNNYLPTISVNSLLTMQSKIRVISYGSYGN